MSRRPVTTDRQALYEVAVQSVDADLDFLARVYRSRRKRPLRRLREDFCGTASLACSWAARGDAHEAWGVDLDAETLDWGRRHRLAPIGDAGRRVRLVRADVRRIRSPRVEAVVAFNFSYCVFHDRSELLTYFNSVRRSLERGGVFVLDTFGGTETMGTLREKTRKPAGVEPDGRRTPAFTYIWEQASFNPVDHHILCHIHFRLPGGRVYRRAFTYDWRLWTIPELRDLLAEAGFAESEVYVEGWDEKAWEADGIFRKRRRFENQLGWVAYVVAWA